MVLSSARAVENPSSAAAQAIPTARRITARKTIAFPREFAGIPARRTCPDRPGGPRCCQVQSRIARRAEAFALICVVSPAGSAGLWSRSRVDKHMTHDISGLYELQ